MQIIPHFFFFVFPLPQPASPIFNEDPIASTRRPVAFRRVKEVLMVSKFQAALPLVSYLTTFER